MSKKKSNMSASKRSVQPSKSAAQQVARRSPSIWVLGGLGLVAVIIVVALVLQGAGMTSQPVAGAPATGTATAGLPAASTAKLADGDFGGGSRGQT